MSLIPFAGAVQKFNRQRDTQYKIERSLRFNSADTAFLNRTPASAGNRKTWTWSGWIKRSSAKYGLLFAAGNTNDLWNSSATTLIGWVANTDSISIYNNGTYFRTTTQVFRDFSAWGHLVVAIDTTQPTPHEANRVKMYWNGVQITAFATSNNPTLNLDTLVNAAHNHVIGGQQTNVANSYYNGYLAEINFIDGQVPTTTTRTVNGVTQTVLTQLGEFDTSTGVWVPKAWNGTYGTNGFYLNFSDNSNTTAATLGKDYSGNGNNWTPNLFSVNAGAGNDSLVDVPTPFGTDTGAGGTVRGNYATWNALDKGDGTLSNGNLDWVKSGSWSPIRATFGVSSGKWYWETTLTSGVNLITGIGISSTSLVAGTYPGQSGNSGRGYFSGDGSKFNNGGSSYGASFTTNDVIGVALDMDAGTLTYYKNGVSQGQAFSGLTGSTWFPMIAVENSTAVANFGQRPFAYTAPSGFKALCTQNLPNPTIVDGGEYFNAVLYTGNGTSQIIDTGLQPDFIWIKRLNGAAAHTLTDSVRGASKQLFSNLTNAEQTDADSGVTAINSTSMTLGDNNLATGSVNGSGSTYVAWNWKANGAGSSNTAGSITSTVSVNTTSKFSIVTYTGTGYAATVGHGLGVAPSMVIVKKRGGTADSWFVWHSGIANTEYLVLNTTAAKATNAGAWNSTSPTSTVFSIGNANNTNENTIALVAYCFAPVAGYSAFGSYTGNGSADGPFVFTGFRPRWVLIKSSSSTDGGSGDWLIYDTARGTYNAIDFRLYANLSQAQSGSFSQYALDILSNGFKPRDGSANFGFNTSGVTYIYAAFAENPFKYSLAR